MDAIVLVAAAVATLIPTFLIGDVVADKEIKQKTTAVAAVVVFFSICYLVANAIALFVSANLSQGERPATFLEAQSASGFISGYEYPLILGDRGTVSQSTEEVSHGLFYLEWTSQTMSGSSILVGYEHADQTREIAEVPISAINFRITADSRDSSLAIDLGAIDAPIDGYTVAKSCGVKVVWGWWVHNCGEPTTLITPGDEGVAGLLRRAFAVTTSKTVTMTVTEEQYRQILGASTP